MRKTRGAIFLAATASFPKSRASYFRFARCHTSALYYQRAWYRRARLVKLYKAILALSIWQIVARNEKTVIVMIC